MKRSRKAIRILIQTSPSAEEADKLIDENYGFESIKEKIAFLKGMFDIGRVGHEKDELDEMTYFAMLSAIINS